MSKIKILSSTPSTINDAAYEMPDRFNVDIEQQTDGTWKASALGFEVTDANKGWALNSLNQQVAAALKAKKIHF